MRRSQKVALGLLAGAVLLGGGTAAAAPALAQTDPTEPGSPTECPVECPFDNDQNRDQMRDRMRDHMGTEWSGREHQQGREHRHGHGPGDGTCWAEPDPAEDGS